MPDLLDADVKLLLPDACWKPGIVSGAVFLYFHDEPLAFTLHPSVSVFMMGADPYEFFRLVDERHPDWLGRFAELVHLQSVYRASLEETGKILRPLHGDSFKLIHLAYPRDWEAATDLLSSSELDADGITACIDPYSASDELFSHLFLEKFLEFRYPDYEPKDFEAMGREAATSGQNVDHTPVDWTKLYDYCDTLFSDNTLEQLLTTAYMFRVLFLSSMPEIFLSNENLLPFLASLPVEPDRDHILKSRDAPWDPIAWEFFRQLVAPIVDPIDAARVKTIQGLLTRHAEIDRLKRRCLQLALELGEEQDFATLQKKIAIHVKANVRAEVQEALDLDTRAVDELLASVVADEKSWAGIGLLLYSTMNGGEIFTAGASIYTMGLLGSKAFRAARDRKEKLRASDYALIYRMKGL